MNDLTRIEYQKKYCDKENGKEKSSYIRIKICVPMEELLERGMKDYYGLENGRIYETVSETIESYRAYNNQGFIMWISKKWCEVVTDIPDKLFEV